MNGVEKKPWYLTWLMWYLTWQQRMALPVVLLVLSLGVGCRGAEAQDHSATRLHDNQSNQSNPGNQNNQSNPGNLGERGLYEVVRSPDVNAMPFTRSVSRNSTYDEHPLHELAAGLLPGIQLDAHSKALLRLEPNLPLVARIQDSMYVSKPGWPTIQLVVDSRVRRTNLIPDSLFLVPKNRYVYGLAVTRDLLLGTLSKYTFETSRVVGIFAMQVSGKDRIAVVVSHDYLKSKPDRTPEPHSKKDIDGMLNGSVNLPDQFGLPSLSIAIFTPGLIFRDLIRLDVNQLDITDPLPHAVGPNAFVWKSARGEEIGFVLKSTSEVFQATAEGEVGRPSSLVLTN